MNTVYIVLRLLAVLCAVCLVSSELYRNRKNLPFIWEIWKRFRPGMFIQVFVLIIIVLATAVFLSNHVPYLHYGWMHLILKNGGNIVTGPVLSVAHSEYMVLRILPPVFLFVFLLVIPFLANGEEKIFRKGYHTRGKMIRQSIRFGLVHLVAGIPIAAGIALIVPGLFFAYKYHDTYTKLMQTTEKKEASHEAVLVSTTYHTLMNSILVVYLIVLTIIYI
ncbi:MAG: hypothetical protein WC878_02255 [Candidatus Paceibacterota bacterium]|jgi:hypothetical protein